MENKTIKFYFIAKLVCDSPLHIGNGLDDKSGGDIMLNLDGKPFIPATALAGVIKAYIKSKTSEDTVDRIFGRPKKDKNDEGLKSEIIFYDAEISAKEEFVISIRDNVKIDENGVAKHGAKFDYEILEPGVCFDFRAELLAESESDAKVFFSTIINGFNSGGILSGAKTSRGLGRMSMSDFKYYEIDLKKNIQDYIDFKWDKVSNDFKPDITECKRYETLKINFKIDTFLFVCTYDCTAHDENNSYKLVDAEQLTYGDKSVVIPGTSWAGVFRHHCERILKITEQQTSAVKPIDIKEVFGNGESKKARASKIIFSETVVNKANMHNRTRNAIDRFTGSAGDRLLFTTRPSYQGEGVLEIKIPVEIDNADRIKNLINVCIQDFNDGLLNIGGEGAIGGGIMKMKAGEWK